MQGLMGNAGQLASGLGVGGLGGSLSSLAGGCRSRWFGGCRRWWIYRRNGKRCRYGERVSESGIYIATNNGNDERRNV